MPSLWFVVPAHGRVALARICLRQLRRTCDELTVHGIKASAVVVACDENLDTAADLGFATVGRVNDATARKFNDGIHFACDPNKNPDPADYIVPMGSDDWTDWRLFLNLPTANTILCFQQAAFVSEDGRRIVSCHVDYTGGVGMRIYPRQMIAAATRAFPTPLRPADEYRERGCDTSILVNVRKGLQRRGGPQIVYGDQHPWQFIDWKTHGEQLNDFDAVIKRFRRRTEPADPFDQLAGLYPAEALEEMHGYYERIRARPFINTIEGGFSQYRVTGKRPYRGHKRGDVFEAVLEHAAEQRALARGDIERLREVTPDLVPGSYRLPPEWLRQEPATTEAPQGALSHLKEGRRP